MKPSNQACPSSEASFSAWAKKKILSVLGVGGKGKIMRVILENAKSMVPVGKTYWVKSLPATMMKTSSK